MVRFQGGESLQDVLDRWKAFLKNFDASVDTLLVTHDVVVRLAILERTDRSINDLRHVRALNGAYAEFEVEQGTWTLLRQCVSDYLAGRTADIERQAL